MQKIETVIGNKVTLIGDPHLDNRTPSSRKDDYAETSLEKLESIKQLMIKNSIKIGIILGDFGNRRSITFDYLVRLVNFFVDCKSIGLTFYSIIGNHDISNDRLDTIQQHPLGMFFAMGIIKPLDKLILKVSDRVNIIFHGYNFKEPILPVQNTGMEIKEGNIHICCAHIFYETSFSDNLTKEQAMELGYNIYYLGHDHQIYKPVQIKPGVVVCRTCSLMRGSSHLYNLERTVYIDGLNFADNDGKANISFNRYELPTKPAEEVFSSKSMATNINVEDFSTSVRQFLQAIDTLSLLNNHSIEDMLKEILKEMELSEPVYNNTKQYLREFEVID